jgi:hypothetical protein
MIRRLNDIPLIIKEMLIKAPKRYNLYLLERLLAKNDR